MFDLELGLRSEKKPKFARITVGRVIVYKFSGDLSRFSVVCLSWAVFYGSLSKGYDLEFRPKLCSEAKGLEKLQLTMSVMNHLIYLFVGSGVGGLSF